MADKGSDAGALLVSIGNLQLALVELEERLAALFSRLAEV